MGEVRPDVAMGSFEMERGFGGPPDSRPDVVNSSVPQEGLSRQGEPVESATELPYGEFHDVTDAQEANTLTPSS